MTTSITRPLAIVGLLVLFLWPRYFFINIAGKGVSGFTFFAMLLLTASVVILVMRPETSRMLVASARRTWPVILVYFAYWIWRIVCDVIGQTPGPSISLTNLDMLYLGSWALIGAVIFTDTMIRAALPYLIVASALIATIFGLVERATGTSVSNMLGFYEFAAGDQVFLATLDAAQLRGNVLRVKSLFSHPIIYGQTMAAFTPVALLFLLQGGVTWRRVLGGVTLACILVSIAISNSRSSYFVLVAAAIVYLAVYFVDFKRGSRLFVALWLLLAGVIVGPLAAGPLLDIASGRTSEEAHSSAARAVQISKGTAALVSSPVFGFGDGAVGPIAGSVGRNHFLTVDDYYLTTAVNAGYGGLALLIAMLVAITVQGVVLAYGEANSWQRGASAAYAGMIVSIGVGLSIVSISDTLAIVFLLAGYIVALSGQRRPARRAGGVQAFPLARDPAAPGRRAAEGSLFGSLDPHGRSGPSSPRRSLG